MQFEERDLKPYSEPIVADKLKEGEVYFCVSFADDEMLIPIMETVIFIGRNLEGGDTETVYFQDVESYREGVRFGSATDECNAKFMRGSENQTAHVFEFERALDVLLSCSLRRRGRA